MTDNLNLRRTIEAAAQRALQRATPTDAQLAERLLQIRRVRGRLKAEEQAQAELGRLKAAVLQAAANAPPAYVDEAGQPLELSGDDRAALTAMEVEERAAVRKLVGTIEPQEKS